MNYLGFHLSRFTGEKNFLTHLCNNTVKKSQNHYLIIKSRKKTNNYFTKLHNSCYNNTHTFQILIMTPEAERFNGWAAMLGFVAAVGAYVTTGQIIPGWF